MYERDSCQDYSFSKCKIKYVEVHWQWCSRKLDRLELVKAQVGVKRLKLLFCSINATIILICKIGQIMRSREEI